MSPFCFSFSIDEVPDTAMMAVNLAVLTDALNVAEEKPVAVELVNSTQKLSFAFLTLSPSAGPIATLRKPHKHEKGKLIRKRVVAIKE